MAYTTIDNPVEYFSATLYTANGTARTIATGHQSDWVWLKRRDGAAGHRIADSVRGANKLLYSDSSTSEQSASNTITGFVSTGFTLGDDSGGYDVNTSSNTMVAWSWKAGTSFTNDASATGVGSIDSAGSVNTDAGFSITSYTGTGSAATVAHGLGVVPSVYILKNRTSTSNWFVYHKSTGATKSLFLDGSEAGITSSGYFNNTEPTSSVFSIGSESDLSGSSQNMIAYCFAEKKGYSKFSSFVGNGNADGPFLFCGFKPAFLIVKNTSANGFNWEIRDNKRDPHNVVDHRIYADTAGADVSGNPEFDFVSNGIKVRGNGNNYNTSGSTYIFMAFAESPFVNSAGAVPNNAR